jgi:hypothetical protein
MVGVVTEVHKGCVAIDVVMWGMGIYIIMRSVVIWSMRIIIIKRSVIIRSMAVNVIMRRMRVIIVCWIIIKWGVSKNTAIAVFQSTRPRGGVIPVTPIPRRIGIIAMTISNNILENIARMRM